MSLLAGLGLFLLGMTLLTDGLKSLAGAALRSILTRLVAGPVSGVGWGALFTTLVQSSTATTLTTIGFVSAGLLTFTQAVGVIFGANLGTTSTGWIVSQLGFKVSLGSITPPIVLAGVLLRLLTRRRWKSVGDALAGFGLLFIGLDLLQHGMAAVAERLDPASLPGYEGAGGLWERLILVGFGFIMTMMMQSSSASMATTLAAVVSGAIGYDQAAALIIGSNLGNTPTAAVASIGAPVAAKRAALAHILFNATTAAVAFVALPLLLGAVNAICHSLDADDTTTRLALFHTMFNVLGVAMLLPVVGSFSKLIMRIIPEHERSATRYVGEALEAVGPVAVEAARRSLAQVLAETAGRAVEILASGRHAAGAEAQLLSAERSIEEVQRFVHKLTGGEMSTAEVRRHEALMHAIDHISRLIDALHKPQLWSLSKDHVIRNAAGTLRDALAALAGCAESEDGSAGQVFTEAGERLGRVSRELATMRKTERRAALADVATGRLEPNAAVARVDALLWVDTVAYHAWRAVRHLDSQPLVKEESDEFSGDKESSRLSE